MLKLLFAILTGDPLARHLIELLSFRRQAFRSNDQYKKAATQAQKAADDANTAKANYFTAKGQLEIEIGTFPF